MIELSSLTSCVFVCKNTPAVSEESGRMWFSSQIDKKQKSSKITDTNKGLGCCSNARRDSHQILSRRTECTLFILRFLSNRSWKEKSCVQILTPLHERYYLQYGSWGKTPLPYLGYECKSIWIKESATCINILTRSKMRWMQLLVNNATSLITPHHNSFHKN